MKQIKYITMALLLMESLAAQAIDFPKYRPVQREVSQIYVSSMDRTSASNKSDVSGDAFESSLYMQTIDMYSCFGETPLLNEDGTAAEIVATIHGPRRTRQDGTTGGNAGTPGGSSGGQLGQPIGDMLLPLLLLSAGYALYVSFRRKKSTCTQK